MVVIYLLKHERWSKIIKIVEEKDFILTKDLAKELNSSEATVRRDINELSDLGKVIKVFGGISKINNEDFIFEDKDLRKRYDEYPMDKMEIGKIAAGIIEDHDMVYLDAGTTVEALVQFIDGNKGATFVTDSLSVAQKLARLEIPVHILPGKVKGMTDSVFGGTTIKELKKYNFNKGFFGTNGITIKQGFTTPDIEEAEVKEVAMSRCKDVFILADISKFHKISGVTFGELNRDIKIITYIDREAKSGGRVGQNTLEDFKDKVCILTNLTSKED